MGSPAGDIKGQKRRIIIGHYFIQEGEGE
jgi:hypothetical protein